MKLITGTSETNIKIYIREGNKQVMCMKWDEKNHGDKDLTQFKWGKRQSKYSLPFVLRSIWDSQW